MDKGILSFIKKTSWFENLPDDVTENLARKVDRHLLKEGDALIEIGDKSDSVFIIRNGWVKITIPEENEGEIVVNHLGPGEFVGELSLIDQKPRSASVIALSEVEALEISRKDFLEVLNEFPMMGLYVISNISSRMRFTLTYLDKAIHWSHKIAEGDYNFAVEEISKAQSTAIIDNTKPDDVRANRFLIAFFEMVEGIQKREQLLIDKVQELAIKIDESKRDKELASLTGTGFFKKLQDESKQIRETRKISKSEKKS
ncbi:MAG: cyclic nucleotide-binding domain-containing protein [Anaerolineales bacterium]|jgi:CRP-like cAMP-binding protein